jgi:geranylgeranyl diphosphate synthase type I
MIPKYAREELKQPLARIAERVDGAIEALRPYSASPVWGAAIDATLAIQRAPKHLLRVQLVLLGSMAGGGAAEGEALERFAVGVELLHLFMLVHDDVMDNATIRRGRPALRIALRAADPALDWQTARDMAIVVGNALAMASVRNMTPREGGGAGAAAACDLLLEACFRAGAGQFQDLLGFRALGGGEIALRRALVDKTAFHSFAAPFAAGLLLANGAADVSPALRWGEHIGVAFQATDDVADLISPPGVTGKDALRDLVLGRPSLPLLLLRERAAEDDAAFLTAIAGAHVVEFSERARLDELIERTGVIAACAERIRNEIEAARVLADAADFSRAAREGMRVFERSLLAHADEVIAAAHEPG